MSVNVLATATSLGLGHLVQALGPAAGRAQRDCRHVEQSSQQAGLGLRVRILVDGLTGVQGGHEENAPVADAVQEVELHRGQLVGLVQNDAPEQALDRLLQPVGPAAIASTIRAGRS